MEAACGLGWQTASMAAPWAAAAGAKVRVAAGALGLGEGGAMQGRYL